jgi:argininosuccinate synthase
VAALDPTINIIAPWRDDIFIQKFVGRNDLFEFAEKHNIPLPIDK